MHSAISQIATLAINRFRIAQNFPTRKAKASYKEIAEACGLSEPVTRRIIRSTMTRSRLPRVSPGILSHTHGCIEADGNRQYAAKCSISHRQGGLAISQQGQKRPAKLTRGTALMNHAQLIDVIEKWPNAPQPTEMVWLTTRSITSSC
jgi:hypothetical protein